MFFHAQKLINEIPPPAEPDPAAANALQEERSPTSS